MAEVDWYNTNAEAMHTMTGKYPAINTYDYVHLNASPCNWIDYGDITPVTLMGRFLSGVVMILGYTIIAVPTGIVSATMIDETKRKGKNGRCPRCNEKTDLKANYCKHCGERL